MREYKILHVEDSASDAELVQRVLKKGGIRYTYCIVDNKEKFIQNLKDFSPDVILCDHSLPQFDSVMAFEIYKSLNAEMAFLLVTGSVSEEYAVDMMKKGIDDYLLKENLQRLPQAIENAFIKREKEKLRKLAEEKLAQSELLLNKAQQMAHIGSLEYNIETKKEIWSNEIYRILGLLPEEIQPSQDKLLSFIHPDDLNFVKNNVEQARKELRDMSFYNRIIRKDGAVRHIYFESKFEFDRQGKPTKIQGIIQDITDGKKAEQEIILKNEQLKSLTSHLQRVREEERTTISREIHDELGQQLTALKMDIDWVLHKQNNPTEALVAKLNEMLQMSDGIISTIRRISSDLRPAIIDDLGLIAALEWKCNDFEEKMGIPCHFVSNVKERKFENHFGINTYRILQETLTNVGRHAAAKSVMVSVNETETELFLEIADDGKGISLENMQNGKTLGIVGMKERAALLGGQLIIEGEKNKGTHTKLILPLKNEYINS